jgi:hypothetical protein
MVVLNGMKEGLIVGFLQNVKELGKVTDIPYMDCPKKKGKVKGQPYLFQSQCFNLYT